MTLASELPSKSGTRAVRIPRSRVMVAAGLIIFRVVVDILYATYVCEIFGYAGYTLNIEPQRALFSYIVFIAFALAMPLDRRSVSSFFLFTIVLLVLLPASSYYAMSGENAEVFALTVLAVGIVGLILAAVPPIALVRPAMFGQRALLIVATIAGIGYLLAYLYASGSDVLAGFNMAEVYDIRLQAKEMVSGLRAYLLGNLCKALAPAAIAILLENRRVVAALLMAFGLMLIMGALGYKEIVVYAVVPFVFHGAQKLGISFQQILLSGLIAVSITAAVWWRTSGQHYPLALLIHRGMIVNAQNNAEYVNYFQDNPHTRWGNSVLRGIVPYEYPQKIPEIIGSDRYGEGQYGFSNVGLVGSGYMHMGWLGGCIYSVIVGMYAYILHCSARLDAFSGTLVFIAVVQIVSADLPSAFVTHGGLLAALLVYTLAGKNRRAGLEKGGPSEGKA